MYRCPHCDQPGISAMRKFCLGPAASATCRACGKRVGVPFAAILAAVPFIAAIVGATELDSWPARVGVLLAGFVIMSVIHLLWVPLIRR